MKALKSDIEKLDKKIDASVTALNEKIKTPNVSLLAMKTDMIWIKRIGGAIATLLVVHFLIELATTFLN